MTPDMSEAASRVPPNVNKRSRPVISCLECRRKKLKCDRTQPCRQCIKVARPSRCQYQPGQDPESNVGYPPAISNRPLCPNPFTTGIANGELLGRNDAHNQLPPPARRGILEELQERVAKLESAVLGDARVHEGSVAYNMPPDLPRPAFPVDETESPSKVNQINSQVSSQFPPPLVKAAGS